MTRRFRSARRVSRSAMPRTPLRGVRSSHACGYTVSQNTLFDYLGYLEDAFLVFLQPKRETSLRKQEHNPKKLHVIDTGLIAAYQPFQTRDLGHKLETVVFLENRRKRKDLFYYTNGSEVDLCDGEGAMFVNTCWNLTDTETFRREKAAMAFGVAQWPKAEGRLLFHEYAPGQERDMQGVLAAWKYLLRL